jgi:hypothetical protein
MPPSATPSGRIQVSVFTAVMPFAATAGSARRGHWCSSPQSVVTTYAAINTANGNAPVERRERLGGLLNFYYYRRAA